MDLSDLESTLPIVGESSEKKGDFGVTWLEEPPSASTAVRTPDVEKTTDQAVAGRLHSCEYCEWGYFGNEASDVDFYIYAALHVRIPRLGQGARAKKRLKNSTNREATEASSTTRPGKKKASGAEKSSESPGKKAAGSSRKRVVKTPRKKRDT